MKRRILWINLGLVAVLIAAGVGIYYWMFAPKTAEATSGRTVAVQQGDVSETVTATGTVSTAGIVELSFAEGGTVTKVKVAQGDTVEENQALAAVDDTSAQQAVEQAKQSYAQAVTSKQQSGLSLQQAQQAVTDAQNNAKLNKQSLEQAVTKAKQDLADAKTSWSTTCLDPNGVCPSTDAWAQLRDAEAQVKSAQTAYDQAVQNGTADETTQNIKLKQAATNLDLAESKAETACNTNASSNDCISATQNITSAQQNYETAQNSANTAAIQRQQNLVNADAKITSANVALKKLQSSLAENAADAVTAAQQALDSAQLAKTKGIASDQQSIQNAQEQVANQQVSNQSVDTGAGSTTADEAAIVVARSNLQAAEDAVDDTVLRSPVAGTVASVTVDKGDAAAAGTAVVTVIPDASFEIVASFSEADALKVAVGQKATVTFDALTGESATGTVTAVDILPSTSEGSNVTTYSATITLDDAPEGVRQGMSASVVVTTNEATDVLWVPSAAVSTAGGQSTVTVRANGVDTVTVVQTGLAGDSGTEITSGLTAGQQIVIDTSTDSGTSGFGFPGGGFGGGGGAVRIGGGGPP